MKPFETTPQKDGGADSFVTKGTPPGQARPEPPGYDREEAMYASMGMTPPPRMGAPHGPSQCTSYDVPVRKWKNGKKR